MTLTAEERNILAQQHSEGDDWKAGRCILCAEEWPCTVIFLLDDLAVERERAAQAEAIVNSITPIGGLDIVTSLQVELAHVKDALSQAEARIVQLAEALERGRTLLQGMFSYATLRPAVTGVIYSEGTDEEVRSAIPRFMWETNDLAKDEDTAALLARWRASQRLAEAMRQLLAFYGTRNFFPISEEELALIAARWPKVLQEARDALAALDAAQQQEEGEAQG